MIQYTLVLNILSVVTAIIALFMCVPAGIALGLGNTAAFAAFLYTIAPTLVLCVLIYRITLHRRQKFLRAKDGFILVTVSWIVASAIGALPFVLSGEIPSYTDAFFETMSGFTTTGASILTDIEVMAPSLLFWRSLTHWLGGMGIVVFTVAVFPLLGIGGVQLLRAESPGPTLEKITTKATQTAKVLWLIYLGLTVLETILLIFGGMNLFDALTHTFGTLATGGFSPKALSVGHYHSAYIDGVITVFMMAAGVNFGLYFYLILGKFGEVIRNSELKLYLFIFIGATAFITWQLTGTVYATTGESLQFASFQAASILTTTGFATADFDLWPNAAKGVLFLLMFVGGCSGSTGGGIKVIRILTLVRQGINEMKYLYNPRGVHRIRINSIPVRKEFIYTVSGFFILYIFSLLVTTLFTTLAGYDLTSSFSGALAIVGNIGPGFGVFGPAFNYQHAPIFLKWIFSFAMLIGRLEVYTVLILLLPSFWKR